MNRKGRTRQHLRAVQALKRFHLARTVEAKLYRASVVARYLTEALEEVAILRERTIVFASEIDRQDAERQQIVGQVNDWNRKLNT